MFKSHFSLLFLGVCLTVAFQNCAQEGAFDAVAPQVSEHLSVSPDTAPQHPDFAEKSMEAATTYELVLADRYYLRSLIEDIFGPRALTRDSSRLFLNAEEFGSPCSAYESYRVLLNGKLTLVDNMQNCNATSPARLVSPVNPKPTVTRQAMVTRACSDWVFHSDTLKHALSRISDGSSIPDGSDENILKAYKLFYRGKPDPQRGVIESLSLIVNAKDIPSYDSWGSALFSICSSSYWQVL